MPPALGGVNQSVAGTHPEQECMRYPSTRGGEVVYLTMHVPSLVFTAVIKWSQREGQELQQR